MIPWARNIQETQEHNDTATSPFSMGAVYQEYFGPLAELGKIFFLKTWQSNIHPVNYCHPIERTNSLAFLHCILSKIEVKKAMMRRIVQLGLQKISFEKKTLPILFLRILPILRTTFHPDRRGRAILRRPACVQHRFLSPNLVFKAKKFTKRLETNFTMFTQQPCLICKF